jgi:hypothetical protein
MYEVGSQNSLTKIFSSLFNAETVLVLKTAIEMWRDIESYNSSTTA